jgi:hypothetical protein
MGPGAAVIVATPFVIVVLALLYLLRRERLRGPTSTTPGIVIWLYRGLVLVLFLFLMYLLVAPFVLPHHPSS